MSERTKNSSRPEESICKRFAYTSHLGAYPNSSDMNELYAMLKSLLRLKYQRVDMRDYYEENKF
ncbi:hypothetical protein FHEFKHOI_01241 [Candidatus Methanoperedenaceae archaeon GB50]|nr:MAG: hypothetical protein KBONHNOK_00426 [Candidatus Methanoperedenaceae archaeon GB50]CAD7772428.1 hypothetical protein AIOGIFDO_01231 [Candidatus Methanoperedenaceae archaeon GB37]CAD7772531.1 hypothetical protein FHEFKHOI_01241 [Candidatus Methanoperedenaceae archaeon GB50]